jgi:hypothetical protein
VRSAGGMRAGVTWGRTLCVQPQANICNAVGVFGAEREASSGKTRPRGRLSGESCLRAGAGRGRMRPRVPVHEDLLIRRILSTLEGSKRLAGG